MNAFHVLVAHGVVEVIQKAGTRIWRCKISNHAELISNTLGNVVFAIKNQGHFQAFLNKFQKDNVGGSRNEQELQLSMREAR